jgi:hypothetical protein
MRNICRSKLLVIGSVLPIIFLIIASCGPVEIKKVTTQKADYYKFTSQKAGLKISVDPYKEENRLQEFFGCDLLSRGVLPVLVVIENQNSDDGYILVKERSVLVMRNTDPTDAKNNLGIGGYGSHDLEKAVKVESAIKPWLFLSTLFIAPALAAEKRTRDELAIKENIEKTQLLDKTVYRGRSNSGFLYFQLKKKEDLDNVVDFYLNMKNIRTNEIVSFLININ